MQLISRLRSGQDGSALITSLLVSMVLLALGMALLAIVDTQAQQSADERTGDRGFNLAESVLTSEAFVLGRNWPTSGASTCGTSSFGTSIGTTPAAGTAAGRLAPNLNASYTDGAYDGATWKVNICDDVAGSTVWSDALLANRAYDYNAGTPNNKVWVRAESTIAGKTRALVGLVQVRRTAALKPKFGLVAGNVSEDLGSATSAITNSAVLTGVTSGFLNTGNPPVAADAAYPPPASGVTGVRCGLADALTQLKTCVTGALGAAAQIPVVDTLITGGKFEQFPYTSSTTPSAIGQLRTQAKDAASGGVYMATAPGANPTSSTDYGNIPSCAISGATSSSVVFIEKVGNGDQYCAINVYPSGVTYKALVIGSGRVLIRGNGSITTYSSTNGAVNLFSGVIYALNQQTSDHTAATPLRELIRIEKGARVKGAVHADGKNATIGLIAPDFDANALINGLLCPGVLCTTAGLVTGLLGSLGLNATLNALINGTCLVSLPIFGCTVSLPGLGVTSVVNGITAQLSTYGSAIHSDVATINALTVYGASGVIPSTFHDLQQKETGTTGATGAPW